MNRTPPVPLDHHVTAYRVAMDVQWLATFRHDIEVLRRRYEAARATYRLANPIIGAAESRTFHK